MERLGSVVALEHDLEVLGGATGDGAVKGGDDRGGEEPVEGVEGFAERKNRREKEVSGERERRRGRTRRKKERR